MKCCSVLFIFKSCSIYLLMMILMYIFYFMQWCTLFYYVTLISLQFLLFLGMVFLILFLFFQYWRCVFFLFLLVLLFPSHQERWLQNVMVLFRYCENNHDSIFKLSVVHVAGTKVSLYHVLTIMVFKLKLLNQKSTSLRSIVCYELCGLCITFDNIKNLNSVR